jgi:hypothetical protein
MSFRAKGAMQEAKKYPMALPVMSVESLEEADDLRMLTCSKVPREDRFVISWNSGFVRSDVDSMDVAANWLNELYQRVIRKEQHNGSKRKTNNRP